MKLLEMFRNRVQSETGTHLELAQAFADLGDPELARHYLDEVIEEGDDEHRETAQSLMENLPEIARVA